MRGLVTLVTSRPEMLPFDCTSELVEGASSSSDSDMRRDNRVVETSAVKETASKTNAGDVQYVQRDRNSDTTQTRPACVLFC